MSLFPCNHLIQNFKALKFWYEFFSSSSPNEHIFALNKTCFSCAKSLKLICLIFYIPFDKSKMKFKTINIFILKISKRHLHNIQNNLNIFINIIGHWFIY